MEENLEHGFDAGGGESSDSGVYDVDVARTRAKVTPRTIPKA